MKICDFPKCQAEAVTKSGMCDYHRNVRIHPSFLGDGKNHHLATGDQ